MQFPESWLRSFCNPNLSTAALAETLTMAGLEVEHVDDPGARLAAFSVARIVEALGPHVLDLLARAGARAGG